MMVVRRVRQVGRVLMLIVAFMVNLVVANARVAWDVVTPRLHLRPMVVGVPARPELGDVGLVLFANLISVTPGTLALEVDPDTRMLFVHVMYPGPSPDAAIADLDRLQLRLVAALHADDVAAPHRSEHRR